MLKQKVNALLLKGRVQVETVVTHIYRLLTCLGGSLNRLCQAAQQEEEADAAVSGP